MSSIASWGLVRIDDRLIHGQVIAVWCRHRKFDRIVIVDDGVAADAFMQEILCLSAPPGLEVVVYPVEKGLEILLGQTSGRETTMILMKTPLVAQQLLEGGLEYEHLNIGGIGSRPGRKNIFKNIAVSPEEIAILKALMERGVEITLLTVPGEKSKSFSELADKL